MWTCPKCETFNRDGDPNCFICACEYKTYVYFKAMKRTEPAPPPAQTESVLLAPYEDIRPPDKAPDIRLDKEELHRRIVSMRPPTTGHKKLPSVVWVILIFILCVIALYFMCSKVVDDETESRKNRGAVFSYSISAPDDQVIECQNPEINLLFL